MHKERKPDESKVRPDPYNICRVRGGPPPSRTSRGDSDKAYAQRRAAIFSRGKQRKELEYAV